MQAKKITKETVSQIGLIDRSFPVFNVGDTLAVVQRIRERIKEGEKEVTKERLQTFEGDVIAIRKNGISSTFTIRKIGAHNVPVERIFPFFTPVIAEIKLIRFGSVRRAKLYYLRDRVGKAARVKEKVMSSRTIKNKSVEQ
ncbi:MAG TPA: 50S ribosomal protein L19 [Patescibacteria group bacterium]|jgi:large subunit ribosomal protein L19|nr:50S ribosomal protein L19 [Patescibacteria group bacterium]